MDKTIITLLNKLGIPSSSKGKKYIVDAIKYIKEHNGDNVKITAMYAHIAKSHNVPKWTRIERTIRHAIGRGVLRGNWDLWVEVCGYNMDPTTGSITNKDFIYCVYDYLEEEL